METSDDTEEWTGRAGRIEHVSVGARRATSRLFALRKILYAERAAGGGEAPGQLSEGNSTPTTVSDTPQIERAVARHGPTAALGELSAAVKRIER